MSFASFISQSKLPSAVRVRLTSSMDPDILDQAYKSTTGEQPLTASNIDGWTSVPPPPVLSDDDDSTLKDAVQTFNESSSLSKSMTKYQDSRKIVEVLTIDKKKSVSGMSFFTHLSNVYVCVIGFIVFATPINTSKGLHQLKFR